MESKKTSVIITVIALILVLVLLGGLLYGYYRNKTIDIPNPVVTMEIEKFGTVKMELYPDIAPESVNNFVTLINNGFYNGLKFHRVVEGFMIQGGDPEGTGKGGAKFSDLYNNDDENAKYNYSDGKEAKGSDQYAIPGEFIANGYDNNKLELKAGTLAMARSDYTSQSPSLVKESYNSGGSQFFIMTTDDHTNLTGLYAGFGKVIEGLDVIQAIEKVECKTASTDEEKEKSEESENTEEETESTDESAEKSTPDEDVIISNVTVDTFGVNYKIPQTLEQFNYMKWLYSLYGLEYNGE